MSLRTWAKVTTRFEALHHWPGAVKEVGFLQHPHRHVFQITVMITQQHDDRDVEYILTKGWLDRILSDMARPADTHVPDFKFKSCEMIAVELVERLRSRHPEQRLKVEVLEDGENGALVEFDGAR